MPEFKNIVLTTDLSSNADAAIPFAVALAKRSGGTIHLFHAFETDSKHALTAGIIIGASAWVNSIRHQRERDLAGLANRILNQYGVVTHYRMADGGPAVEVARFAEHVRADVIVTATHGRTGLTHLMLGSVAERILRLNTVPVLTVRPGETPFDCAGKFKTVLMPTDFSENATAAEPFAIAMAKKDGAKLALVHVIDNTMYYTTIESDPIGVARGMSATEGWFSMAKADAEMGLSDLGAAITSKFGVQCEQITCVGRVAEKICAIAKELPADLIVISTHGHTGLSHLMFGSVAEKVVRMSPVPVLSIKPATIAEKK